MNKLTLKAFKNAKPGDILLEGNHVFYRFNKKFLGHYIVVKNKDNTWSIYAGSLFSTNKQIIKEKNHLKISNVTDLIKCPKSVATKYKER